MLLQAGMVPAQPAQQRSRPDLSFSPHTQRLLQLYAKSITVKVMSGDNWGSGILVSRRGQEYTVVTNQHVLWIGQSFTIQTVDGKRYSAVKDPSPIFGEHDLGLLTFNSTTPVYPLAKLGCSGGLTSGSPVFAAGFPLPLTPLSSKGFKFTSGAISMIMPKAFEGGYQLGYSNYIEKGMSGGPVLNRSGELVAINGMHQEPLWGNPYVFEDGSFPQSGLFDQLYRLSWAIPVERVLRHPKLSVLARKNCTAVGSAR